MPEQFTGLVEIQADEEVTTIELDGASAEARVGGNGRSGIVSVRTETAEERVRLESRGVIVRDADGLEVIQLIGIGRQLVVRNGSGQAVLRLEGNGAELHVGIEGQAGTTMVHDAAGREAVRIDGAGARLRVGVEGNAGEVRLIDGQGREAVHLNGGTAELFVGARNNEGDIRVLDGEEREVFHFNGGTAELFVGARNNEGDIRVLDGDGRQSFHLNGGTAELFVGARNNEGDIRVLDGEEREVFHFNGANARLTLGARGSDGDLYVLNDAGDVTIRLDGNSGDVLLLGADCAESFDVANVPGLEPGMVMVIDDDGRLRQSTIPYDKKVAGILSGAGAYRPGIILDSHGDQADRMPLALTGKVYCMVDATHGAIEVGDLLTTSPTPGHAMKASDSARAFGAVIGKALRSWSQSKGLIPVLVALQ